MKLRHAIGALVVLHLLVGASAAQAQKGRKSNVITEEEIAKASAGDAYDLIRILRPGWFRTRGAVSTREGDVNEGGVAYYVDGMRVASVEDVRLINLDRIKEIRFLNAVDATNRYGTGHPSGAVEITTKR